MSRSSPRSRWGSGEATERRAPRPQLKKKEYFFHIFFSMFDGYFERRFKQQFFSASPLRAAATVRRGTVSSQRRQPWKIFLEASRKSPLPPSFSLWLLCQRVSWSVWCTAGMTRKNKNWVTSLQVILRSGRKKPISKISQWNKKTTKTFFHGLGIFDERKRLPFPPLPSSAHGNAPNHSSHLSKRRGGLFSVGAGQNKRGGRKSLTKGERGLSRE